MRSRAQTIAIILSKYKKRSGAHSAAFDAMDRPKVRDVWNEPGEAYARTIKSGDVQAAYRVRDGIALFGTIRVRNNTAEPAFEQTDPRNQVHLGTMYKGKRTPSASGDVTGNHVQRIMREFVRQVLADPDVHTISTMAVNPKIKSLLLRYGGVAGTGEDHSHITIDVNANRKQLTRFTGDKPTSFSMATPKQGLRNVINKLKAQGHRASDFRTVFRSQPSAFDDVVKKSGFMPREWDDAAVGTRNQVFTGSKRIAIAHGDLMRSSDYYHKGAPQSLFKARVLKKGLTRKKIAYDVVTSDTTVRGHEYRSKKQIPASQIRLISKDKPKRQRKGWR